jgi:hypothetical protein
MNSKMTPADRAPVRLLEDCLRAFPPEDKARMTEALLPWFSENVEEARREGNLAYWKKADQFRALVDAVDFLAYRARLLDRLEDALPDLGRVEWELERKEAVA